MLIRSFFTVILSLLFLVNYSSENTQYQRISKIVNKQIQEFNLPSVVVGITNADSIVYLNAFGDAQLDHEFVIGSNSKSFSALAILMLEQKGKLNTKDKVISYLPWFKYKNKNISDLVTIQDLLNHTSGIPRYLGMYSPEKNINKHYSSLLNKVDPKQMIGSTYEYSNLNYQILGLIIEKVGNHSYADFIQMNILTPLQMNNTFASYENVINNNLIQSYQYLTYYPLIKKKPKFNNYEVSSGFISSTAKDMCNYLKSFMQSDSIFSDSILKKLFKPRADIKSNYASGWEIRPWKDIKRIKHDGLTQSFASSMLILPEKELGIIILTNVNNSPATLNIADGIIRILNDREQVDYSTSSFYMRNSLPFFALWIIVIFSFRLRKWLKLKAPIGFKTNVKNYLMLILGICFGLFWVVYLPSRFNTPLPAIIDYEPNSGISLIIIATGFILNSSLNFFIKTKT